MKTSITVFFVFILFAVSVWGGAFLYDFQARTQGENVVLEWKTHEEKNLKEFVVERKNPEGSFVEIASVQPKGSNSYYEYTDESAYKANDLVFIYRLKIVDIGSNNKSYSNEVSVSPNISGVKRTWGSIKAMFR